MKGWKREWPWWVLFALAGWVVWTGAGRYSGQLLVGLGLFFLAILPALLLLWWLDRLPPLAAKYWVRAVGWGLLVAPVVASRLHLYSQVVVEGELADSGAFDAGSGATLGELAGTILSAPLWEETFKALLPLIFLFRSASGKPGTANLAGPWPALLFGSLVTLFFGTMENSTHYARTSDGWGDRFLFAYLHLLFVLPALLAIGYAAFLPTLSRRLALIAVGFFFSIVLHGLWNWEARLGSIRPVAPWIEHAVILSPFVIIATWILVYLDEARRLQREGMPPTPLSRPFRRSTAATVAASREKLIRRALDEDPHLATSPSLAGIARDAG
jgi:RsiW-degrading membrane proteinase PrsW (M82 family)